MKKSLITMLALATTMTTLAAGYDFLTVRQQDGTEQHLPVDGLVLTFTDDQMKASGATTATFPLNTLDAMYFSDGTTNGISESRQNMTTLRLNGRMLQVSAPEGSQVIIANVGGMLIDRYTAGNDAINTPLRPGIYIIKIDNKATKINVK